jgi:hypothetical protein
MRQLPQTAIYHSSNSCTYSFALTAHLWALDLVVALDNIRVRRWRNLGLPRAALSTLRWCSSSRRLSTLLTLFRLGKAVVRAALPTRELPVARLTAHSAIVLSSASSGLFVRDNVVGRSSVAALAVRRHLLVCVVWVGILQDDIPRVQEAGKETETTEGNVDERVGTA